MFEVILFVISLVLGIPFLLGYLVGKSDRKPSSEAKNELHDRLQSFIASQPDKIKKTDLLKVLHPISEPVEIDNAKTSREVKVVSSHSISSEPTVKQKPKNEDQNINTILYVASFLLVAAAVLFIGTNLPDIIKVIGAWGISVGFYFAGLLLHRTSKRLRPAAIAFVGTGLALLPFAGLAMNIFVIHDATMSWFITSLLGLFAFFYASLQLQSQVLAYLTLGFIFSLTTSSVAVLQAPLLWTFVMIIVVASLCNMAAFLKPKSFPSVFLKPVDESGQLAVPLALIGSLLVTDHLPLWQYTVLFTVATLHYAIAAVRPVSAHSRGAYIFAARWLAMIAALIFAYDQSRSWEVFGFTLTGLATLQVLASMAIVKKKTNDYDVAWLWLGMTLQLLALLSWVGASHQDTLVTMTLAIVTLTSVIIALYIRRSRYAVIGVFTVAALLSHVGLNIIEPSIAHYQLALMFVVGSVACLVARALWCKTGERLNVSASACVLYGVLALLFIIGEPSGWQAIVWCALAIIAAAASYIEKEPNFFILANTLFVISVFAFTDTLHISDAMRWLVTSWLGGGVLYIAGAYLGLKGDVRRNILMTVFGLFVLFFVSFLFVFSEKYVVEAASTLLVGAALLWYEGSVRKRHGVKEIAVLVATLALQRLVAYAPGDIDMLVYTHWWALVLALLAWLRYRIADKQIALNWLIASLVLLSVPTGFSALDQPEKYQILFLLEHVALLIAGVLSSYRLVTTWGTVGVALAVLYWLQGYTYVLVGLVGIGLIAFAIWRLLSRSSD